MMAVVLVDICVRARLAESLWLGADYNIVDELSI